MSGGPGSLGHDSRVKLGHTMAEMERRQPPKTFADEMPEQPRRASLSGFLWAAGILLVMIVFLLYLFR